MLSAQGGYSKYTWRGGGGGGGPTYFFGLKIYMLGIFLGQEICHVFFLGLKKIRVFFWVLCPSELIFSVFCKCGAEGRMKRH